MKLFFQKKAPVIGPELMISKTSVIAAVAEAHTGMCERTLWIGTAPCLGKSYFGAAYIFAETRDIVLTLYTRSGWRDVQKTAPLLETI